MALIRCPECGKEVSDKSDICVGCGFPIQSHLEAQTEQGQKKSRGKKTQKSGAKKGAIKIDDFFEKLYKKSIDEIEYAPITTEYAIYSLHIFAILDVILCYKKGYDRFASVDWMEANGERVYARYSKYEDDVRLGLTIPSYYSGHRLDFTPLFKESVEELSESGDIKYDKYIKDLMYVFRADLYDALEDKENPKHEDACKWANTLEDRISSAISEFSKIAIIDDYARQKEPTPEQFGLTDKLLKDFKRIEEDSTRKEGHKNLVPLVALVVIAIVAYVKRSWGYLLLAPAAMVILSGMGNTSNSSIRKKLIEKNSEFAKYYSFLDAVEEYKKKYNDEEDKIE